MLSSHITIYAGGSLAHTIANPGPTEFPAGGVQFNRRTFANLTGRTRAYLQWGGSTSGINTAEEIIEYTTDLTGATGWAALGTYDDGATGPLCSVFRLQGNGTQRGPWCTIVEAARTLVCLRARGRNGDGATAFNTFTAVLEVAGDPLYAGMSLAGATAGRGVIMFGGSQIAGGGTIGTGPGEFGTLTAGLVAVPAGSTLRRQGVVLTSHDAGEHGAEAGVLAELADAGKSADLVCRYVDATNAAAWTDTHLATLAADVTTAGITPRVAFYIGGGTDADTNTTIGKYDFELCRLRGKVEQLWPRCALVWMPQASHDPAEHPKLPEARVIFKRRLSEPYNGRSMWVDNEPTTSTNLQGDDRHPTSAGEVEIGRAFAAAAIAGGIL